MGRVGSMMRVVRLQELSHLSILVPAHLKPQPPLSLPLFKELEKGENNITMKAKHDDYISKGALLPRNFLFWTFCF